MPQHLKPELPDTKEALSIIVYRFLNKHGIWIFTVLTSGFLGFLVGVISNLIADPTVKNFTDLLFRLYDVRTRPLNWLNWIVLIAIVMGSIFILLFPRITHNWRRRQSYEAILASILQRLKHESVFRFDVISVEKAVTLQKCPEIERGWLPSQVVFDHKNTQFRLPSNLVEDYNKFFNTSYKKKHGKEDGFTVMLEEVPVAWTDRLQRLELKTKVNLFSYSQFYWHKVNLDSDWHNQAIDELHYKNHITFPNDLCMHLVVATKKGETLLTCRSVKVADRARTWSCSIEERLKPDDLQREGGTPLIIRWVNRALFEELGISSSCYAEQNFRILSVFLESDLPNIAIVAIVTLELDKDELDFVLSQPRPDYEFMERDYLTLDDMAKELIRPSRSYHPTSRYRMLMVLLHRLGEPSFARKFVNLVKS